MLPARTEIPVFLHLLQETGYFQMLFQLFGEVYVFLELGPFFAVKTEPLTDEKSGHGGADSITIVHT